MTSFLQRPEADLGPFVIYILIALLWIVGKVMTGKKARQRQSEEPEVQPSPDEAFDENVDRDVLDPALRDFVEAMTGKKVSRSAPAPPPPQAPVLEAPFPPPVAPPLPIPRTVPREQNKPQETARISKGAPEGNTSEEDAFFYREEDGQAIYQSEIGDPSEAYSKVTLGSLSALSGMEAMRIPMPSHHLPRMPSIKQHTNFVALRKRKNLKKALVHRLVLGPPRFAGYHPDEVI